MMLDDLMLVAPSRLATAMKLVSSLEPAGIGPLVEYVCHQQQNGELPPIDALLKSDHTLALGQLLFQGGPTHLTETSLKAKPFEFAKLHDGSDVQRGLWRAFMGRFVDAATQAGFNGDVGKGFAGAFGELHDNARLHSEAPQTAVMGYRWILGEFEMVVADCGIGVLESMRSHPDYGDLNDHGEALKVALSSGETRFGRGSGHGTGFDTVFRSLASLRGTLRFRSGDHSLELDGLSPSLINSSLRQRRHFQGFLASIICRPN